MQTLALLATLPLLGGETMQGKGREASRRFEGVEPKVESLEECLRREQAQESFTDSSLALARLHTLESIQSQAQQQMTVSSQMQAALMSMADSGCCSMSNTCTSSAAPVRMPAAIPFQQLFTVESGGLRLHNGELIAPQAEANCYDWLSGVRVNTSELREPKLDLNELPLEALSLPDVKPRITDEARVLEDREEGRREADSGSGGSTQKKRMCAKDGCQKGAAPPTSLCISHGGGRRCEYPDCDKAKRAPSKFCRRHGGGKRCQKEGCQKAAISAYEFCAKHGGGRRCCIPDCGKYAEPPTDRCKGHGGGPRCQIENCSRSARRPTRFCSAHGGGKRCEIEGCGKAAVKHARCWMHGGKEMRKRAREEKAIAEKKAEEEASVAKRRKGEGDLSQEH